MSARRELGVLLEQDDEQVEEGVREAGVRPVEEHVAAAVTGDVREVEVAVDERVRHRTGREPLARLDEARYERRRVLGLRRLEPERRGANRRATRSRAREPRRTAVEDAEREQLVGCRQASRAGSERTSRGRRASSRDPPSSRRAGRTRRAASICARRRSRSAPGCGPGKTSRGHASRCPRRRRAASRQWP